MTTRLDPVTTRVRATEVAGGLALGAVLGALIGVVTSYAQGLLSGPWSALANAASPWLLGAFVAGLVVRSGGIAAGAGLLACAAEVVGYYGTTALRGFGVGGHELVFWTVCGLVGGPVFGWAAWTWRHGADGWLRAWAGAVLPATFAGEAVGSYVLRLHYGDDAVLFAVIAALCAAVVAAPAVVRARVVPPVIVLTAAGVVLYAYLLAVVTG